MKSMKWLIHLLGVLCIGSLLVSITACTGNKKTQWPDNLLLNPDAEDEFDHWEIHGESAWLNSEQGDSMCFSIAHGSMLSQEVSINKEDGEYALLIGCVAAGYVHPNGNITDLPFLYGYMFDENHHIDKYLQGQNMGGDGIIQDEWTTAWGIFPIPETTTSIEFFMQQGLTMDDDYIGAAAYFDDLGMYQFESEEMALKFVDNYQNRCGTASMVEIVPGKTITILPGGQTTTTNREGVKRIQISVNLGENRIIKNPPVVMYWSDDINVEGIESAEAVSNREYQYTFDLPSSDELEICEWMKYRWIVNYENTLLLKTGIKVDEERYVMPDTTYNGNSVSHAMCQEP